MILQFLIYCRSNQSQQYLSHLMQPHRAKNTDLHHLNQSPQHFVLVSSSQYSQLHQTPLRLHNQIAQLQQDQYLVLSSHMNDVRPQHVLQKQKHPHDDALPVNLNVYDADQITKYLCHLHQHLVHIKRDDLPCKACNVHN